jgi:hypothetical protein
LPYEMLLTVVSASAELASAVAVATALKAMATRTDLFILIPSPLQNKHSVASQRMGAKDYISGTCAGRSIRKRSLEQDQSAHVDDN